jgi:hypothetical protein
MQKALNVYEQIKQLGLLYFALIAGQLGVAPLLFLFVEDTSQSSTGVVGGSWLPVAVTFFCLMSVGMSFFIYNQRKESGRKLKGALEEKLEHYRTSFITRAGLLEGSNLVALIFYFFVERNYIYLVLFAVGMVAFSLIRPSLDRIIEDYQFSASEQNELRNSLN